MSFSLTRVQTEANLSKEARNIKVKIQDAKAFEFQKDRRRQQFLHDVMSNPEIMNCGSQKFDKMVVYFENGLWTMELTVTEEIQNGQAT